MGNNSGAESQKSRPRWWEVLLYVVGGAVVALGAFVWAARAGSAGEWTLRLSQLWDSIGLVSLGLAVVAIGLTLTILRVQNREAARSAQETSSRQAQHEEVLRRIADISQRTHVTVTQTNERVQEMYESQVEAAKVATRTDPESDSVPVEEVEGAYDELDDVSLEGIREGDIEDLALGTYALADDRLLSEVVTRDGKFYPIGAVPIGVLADIFEGWESALQTKDPWRVGRLVGAYRSYSAKALAKGVRTLRGAPWFVTFQNDDGTLVTYYLSRTGRKRLGEDEKRAVVKQLVGQGSDARWVPLVDTTKNQ